ncbi:hypothetical protein [Polaribacter sp. HaHaR_3_91]|uniref:hypothetical protein n=1 Tax=Polaribacter sp. HaHaR_3_91 TaxID=2745561 RepID=UPI001C4FAAB6|nr:hypothetical protein [Polaribacter sp. HaHaR_3_91]QXP62754.1 hypothetical protein H0I27_12875 [Polaribacter sp. HaHaR_3_91]
MKKILYFLVISFVLLNCTTKKTELVLLGTVHEPIENFTSDSLYNILEKIKPDLILFEVDSSFFTNGFQFKKTWNSNENIATVKYMNRFNVDVRPYEFTGRNEYRVNIGARPTDQKATKLLDSLYETKKLDSLDMKTYKNYLNINDSLISFIDLGAKEFNNYISDKTAEKRQEFQYKKLLEIMRKYPVFSDTYFYKSNNDSISYFKGYEKASEFWDLRNRTMSRNILHFVKEYKGSKIVVLNGFFHRYYLKSLIEPKQRDMDFIIKEFYEY